MPARPPIAGAISFVDAINPCDLAGLGDLMTADHSLIWIADVEDDKVATWTLVADTSERRRTLHLPPSSTG